MDSIKNIIKSLPPTRKDVDWDNRISLQLPDVMGEDSIVSLFSKEEVKKWIEDFKQEYGESPKFKQENNEIKITNPKFTKLQHQISTNKQQYLDRERDQNRTSGLDENKTNTKMKKSQIKELIKKEIEEAGSLQYKKINKSKVDADSDTFYEKGDENRGIDESWESSWNSFLNEKKQSKKKKKDGEETETPSSVEDIGLDNLNTPDESSSTPPVNTSDVNPDIKSVQDALTQAQAAAEKLKDDKLSHQVGNLITFFTRKYISKNDSVPSSNQ